MNLAAIFTILITLIGCQSIPSNSPSTLPVALQDKMLEAESILVTQPKNPAAYANLAEIYYQAYRTASSVVHLDKAMNVSARLDNLVPNNPQIKARLYSLYIDKARFNKTAADQNRYDNQVEDYFNGNPVLTDIGMMPPSFMMALRIGDDNKLDLIKALQSAISDSPRYYASSAYLAEIHAEAGRYKLADAVLRKAIKQQKHPRLYEMLYEISANQVHTLNNEGACYVDSKHLFEKSLEDLKEWEEMEPSNIDVPILLTEVYEALGLRRLGLASAKKAFNLVEDTDTLILLSSAYAKNGRISLAREFAEKTLTKESGNIGALEVLSEIEYGAGNWQAAIDLQEKLIEGGNSSEYELYRISSAYRMLGQESKADEIIKKRVNVNNISDWSKALRNYLLGDISEELLLSKAKDSCKNVEAYSAIAMNAVANENQEKAKEFFKLVVAEKVLLFRETISAQSALAH